MGRHRESVPDQDAIFGLLDETESGQKAEKRGVLDHMIKSGGAVCGGKELSGIAAGNGVVGKESKDIPRLLYVRLLGIIPIQSFNNECIWLMMELTY
jgi:hypothetical protein